MRFGPPLLPDLRRTSAEIDLPFICGVLAMFGAGCDTAEIAFRLHERESVVARALAIGREGARLA